jgi:hypothetical protein
MAHAVKPTTPRRKQKSEVELEVERRRAAAERARGMLAHLAPGRSLSEELIANRREEARAEARDEEAAQASRRSAQG